MTEKGCGNCYYMYFDERAYPCSLCIRGIERTDKWQPSKKTKADRKTEPQKPSDDDETIQAIAHLQKVGWLQEHDRALTEPQRGCDADCNEDCTECAKETELWKAEQTERSE